jgi:lysozyme family protein
VTISNRVRTIQTELGVPVDGIMGSITLNAIVAAVQELKALKAAGAAGAGGVVLGTPEADKAASGHPDAISGAFERALKVILRHEGGFVNHPRDPGGMTNLGVTRATWEGWTGKKASEAEMRGLTHAKVAPVYRKNYWDKLRCDDLPPGLALCVFDFGVNAGPARAGRYLQRIAGAAQDGVVGPATIAAVKGLVGRVGEAEAVRQYQEARRGYYRQLSTFATFGRGWLRRVDETETEALRMVK